MKMNGDSAEDSSSDERENSLGGNVLFPNFLGNGMTKSCTYLLEVLESIS